MRDNTDYLEKMIENSEELKHIVEQVTPKGKPTQRWIESVPIDACIAEYELIKNKTSNCSTAQRKYIQERVEKHRESTKLVYNK